jgi:cyclic pyranopterin phosphate synthase
MDVIMTGWVFSINIGSQKGGPKKMAASCVFKEGSGIEGDAHAGPGDRQVSLLAIEAIEELGRSVVSDGPELEPGMFAENITTQGLDLTRVKIGDRLAIGAHVIVEIAKIGKTCHGGCSVTKNIGRCIMPEQGIFAVVIAGGAVKVYDKIVTQQKGRSWLKI